MKKATSGSGTTSNGTHIKHSVLNMKTVKKVEPRLWVAEIKFGQASVVAEAKTRKEAITLCEQKLLESTKI